MDRRPVIIGNHADFFRDGDTFASPTLAAASRARASNVATIVTGTAHGLVTGDVVTLASFGDATYNATGKSVTVVNATTFTYANTGDDETTTVDTAGTVTKTGTAGRESRPHDSDAGWISLGVINQLETEKKQDEVEIYAPNPGRLELYDVIESKRVLGHDFVAEEISAFAMETLYGTAPLTEESTDYTPLDGDTKKGWLRIKQYDQTNTLVNTVYSYCYLKVNGKVTFGDKEATIPFSTRQLTSTKNSGLLAA